MNKMRLDFFFEESGLSKVAVAKLAKTTKQNVNWWLKNRNVWVWCDDEFEIDRIEDHKVQILYSRNNDGVANE